MGENPTIASQYGGNFYKAGGEIWDANLYQIYNFILCLGT